MRVSGRIVAVGAVLVAGVGLTGPAARAALGERTSVEGVWRSDGYGMIIAIEGDRLRTYDATAIGCLPGLLAGNRMGPSGSGGEVTFGQNGIAMLGVRVDGARRAVLRMHGSVGVRHLHRMKALPDNCSLPVPERDPVMTFDVFWQTFAENYPFFTARGIDWRAMRDRYRPQVSPQTTDDQLFSILREMIEPLNDMHTGLYAGEREFGGARPGTELPTAELDKRIIDFVVRRDLGGQPLSSWGKGRIGYADLPGHQGYLRISGFSGYTDEGGFAAESAELDRALDAVFTGTRAKTLRGLIIDLRVNGGGSDALGIQIARRLTDRPYVAYRKQARNDPAHPGRFTRPQPLLVRPFDGPIYRGRIAVLTGGSTVSAGETFTQALIDRRPRPVRIGQHTQGVFSDVMARTLPGHWVFGLPNERFLSSTNSTFDGPGIPPHLRTPVFTKEEFAHDRDSGFDRARTLLSAREPWDRADGGRPVGVAADGRHLACLSRVQGDLGGHGDQVSGSPTYSPRCR